jgi:hypothetical protein
MCLGTWGPLVTVLIILIKIEDVNRRVRRVARATRVHVLDVRVRVRHVRRACLAVSKLFIY